MIPRIGTGFPLAERVNKFVSADFTFNNTGTNTTIQSGGGATLANLPELSFSVQPNEIWIADVWLDIGAALATTGAKLALVVPSGATMNIAGVLQPDVYAAANLGSKRTTTSGTALDWVIATQAGVGNAQVMGMVWIKNGSTAGLAQIQAAQSTSSATALLIRAGSFIRGQRIA